MDVLHDDFIFGKACLYYTLRLTIIGFFINVTFSDDYLINFTGMKTFLWICIFPGPYSTFQTQITGFFNSLGSHVCSQISLVLGGVFYLILHLRTLRPSENRDKKLGSHVTLIKPDFIGNRYTINFYSFLLLDEYSIAQEKIKLAQSGTDDTIRVAEVQKIYSNQFKALEDLSFTVPKNQIFCLLGPNSAGKSTAFDILTGGMSRTSGDIHLSGHSLPKQGGLNKALSQAGICFQNNTLFDYMTPEQHLRVYAELKGMSREEIAEITSFLLTSLYMTDKAKKKVYTLSGGTKRKLCAAIALLFKYTENLKRRARSSNQKSITSVRWE